MHRLTVAWVLFVVYVGLVLAKPTKHKSAAKKIDKRWDLFVNQDPILSKGTPSDCQSIIDEYSNGKILMYEYKIQMKRCLNKAKDGEKKMQVPGPFGYQTPIGPMMNFNMPDQQQGMPGLQAAAFNPNMGQTQYNAAPAAPVPHLIEAAFAPSPMNQYPANPAPFQPAEPSMAMNAVAKSNIPDNTQPQAPASQANAVFDQWRASSFGEATADKKDQTPNAPVAPANDQFAEFMKMQSASSSSNLEAPPASQQAAMPAATQQRSNIPQQASMFPMQPQTLNTVPGQGQAFYMQPEENGNFPESP